MTIERALLYLLGFGIGVVAGYQLALMQPQEPELECPGTIYDERSTGGVRWCAPKQECPKGPRGEGK